MGQFINGSKDGWGSQVSLPTSQQTVGIVEIDELHTYIGSKKVLLGMDCC